MNYNNNLTPNNQQFWLPNNAASDRTEAGGTSLSTLNGRLNSLGSAPTGRLVNRTSPQHYFDQIMRRNNSSLATTMHHIKSTKPSNEKVVTLLVRKAVQNCPNRLWHRLSAGQKSALAKFSFNQAISLLDITDRNKINDIYDFCLKYMDASRLDYDHYVNQQCVRFNGYEDGVHHNDNSSADGSDSEDDYRSVDTSFSDTYISDNESVISRAEKECGSYPFNKADPLPTAPNKTTDHQAAGIIEARQTSTNCIGASLKLSNRYVTLKQDKLSDYDKLYEQHGMKRISGFNLDIKDSVVVFGFIKENGNKQITHACRRIEGGFWQSVRGIAGSRMTYLNPEFDSSPDSALIEKDHTNDRYSDEYGYPIAQYVPKETYNKIGS